MHNTKIGDAIITPRCMISIYI